MAKITCPNGIGGLPTTQPNPDQDFCLLHHTLPVFLAIGWVPTTIFGHVHIIQKQINARLVKVINTRITHGGEDAAEKIRAGASLVQFYSGFIYRGPDLVSEVAETLANVLSRKNS